MKTSLVCEFKCSNVRRHTTIERISDVQEGFWVNSKFEFTRQSDNKYWIPPAQIIQVNKLEEQDEYYEANPEDDEDLD